MFQPLFLTLFTPTFNRSHTLHRVYESIKTQTLLKVQNNYIFEWVIVDDGSTDETKVLVQKWQKEHDFSIIYYFQENRGKPAATRAGIELAKGELFLICDSDDAFLPETFETFYKAWNNFTEEEKIKCGGVGVLCQDQFGKRVGCDYPIENRLIPTLKAVFDWQKIGLGETWALLKTENLKKYFVIPEKAKALKFIPESFFWNRITFEARPSSFFLNKVLRVYYIHQNDSISCEIRTKYPKGFLFESQWFITKYWWILFIHPKIYLKHLLKFIYFNWKLAHESK